MNDNRGNYTLNNWYTYGKNDAIIMTDKSSGRKKVIVDNSGQIMDFPGIIKEEFWINELNEGSISPYVRYRTEFEMCQNGNYLVLWEVQPDGRYWADDDGFGGTSDDEIVLYTYMDCKGTFLGPFRIYKIGTKKIFKENDIEG